MSKDKKIRTRIGEKLKFYRKRSELSLDDLSKLCGVSASYLSKIEKSERMPTIKLIHKIGEALKLESKELSYLLGVNFYKNVH